ncbi:MAG: PmoA family protein [bacterium]|nr:PmoA family protein [bacterium]
MFFRLLHKFNDNIELYYGERLLFRYVYYPRTAQHESPRPYFHPIRTLAGDTLTLYRPHDHRWQHGLSMAVPFLSGENFWGGPSFVLDENGGQYIQKANNGQQRHEDWESMTCDDHDGAHLVERLAWMTQSGEKWLDETRTISVTRLDETAGHWTLKVGLRLTNVRGHLLEFGSPTTEGRPNAGYGGLHWRGARDLQGGTITLADGRTGKTDHDLMGQAAPWLAYSGQHDGLDRASTLIFVDDPANPRFPTQWFTRTTDAAAVSFAFAFDQRYPLPPGETLALNYRLIVVNGVLSHEQIMQVTQQINYG